MSTSDDQFSGLKTPRFKLIEPGQVIQVGDQFLEQDCETWTTVPIDGAYTVSAQWMIGCRHNPDMMMPYRRPITNTEGDCLAAK